MLHKCYKTAGKCKTCAAIGYFWILERVVGLTFCRILTPNAQKHKNNHFPDVSYIDGATCQAFQRQVVGHDAMFLDFQKMTIFCSDLVLRQYLSPIIMLYAQIVEK